jgi:hypothetical protein
MDYRSLACHVKVRYPGNLASIFSPAFIRRLSDPSPLHEILDASGLAREALALPRIGDVFDFSYAVLQRHYRCEYLYKNAIAAKILLGRHSPRTATLLTETGVSECKADLVLVNGTTTAYEIKTELDSLDRLPAQLQAYSRAFDNVYVVTHEACVERVAKSLPEGVGLLVFTNRYTLSQSREAVSNCDAIDSSVVFDMLRRAEYVPIIRRHFGVVPDVPNTIIYTACRKLFLELSKEVVRAELANALKARGRPLVSLETIDTAPHSLKFHAIVGDLGPHQSHIFRKSLEGLLPEEGSNVLSLFARQAE